MKYENQDREVPLALCIIALMGFAVLVVWGLFFDETPTNTSKERASTRAQKERD